MEYSSRPPNQGYQRAGRIFDLGLVGGDQEVKTLSRAAFCQESQFPTMRR
jgi:hypothetical protein